MFFFFFYYIARAKSKDVNNVRHQSFVFELLYTWLKPFTTAPPLWKLALPTKPGQHHISWALLRLSHFWLSHPLKWSSRCRRGESWPSLSSSLFCFQLFLPLSMWEWTEGSWTTLLCYVTSQRGIALYYTLCPPPDSPFDALFQISLPDGKAVSQRLMLFPAIVNSPALITLISC